MSVQGSVKFPTKEAVPSKAVLARALLGRILGFRDCPAEVLDELVSSGRMHEFTKGECVVRRGDAFDRLGLLVTGSLESTMTRHDGHRHLAAILQPGDVVGLIPILDGLGNVNDLWTRTPSAMLLIPGAQIRQLRSRQPSLVLAFERQLAFRSRLLYERLSADPGVPLINRLANMLQIFVTLYGLPRDSEVVLDMKLSQTDLADWLGVTRQSINAAVKALELEGILSSRYSSVTIRDSAKLAAMAASLPYIAPPERDTADVPAIRTCD